MAISFLVVALFSISMVSAAWYNPFTWGDSQTEIIKGERWIEVFSDNPDFYTVIPDKTKHDADIYLCSKSATKKNDLKDLDLATSFKAEQKELQTKDKLKAIEYEGAICYYYKPTKDEKFLKFDKHSTHLVYTNESIIASNDDGVISELSLITPDYNYKNGKPNKDMGYGNNLLVHTFHVTNYSTDSITNLRAIDMNTGEEVERNIKVMSLTYEEVEVPTYEKVCSSMIDGREICKNIINGSENVLKEKWIDLVGVEGWDYTLGIFADVYDGDYVDIDFDFYGYSVADSPVDWATWTAGLNVDLDYYYKFDESSGDAINSVDGTNNGTNNGLTYEADGIINYSWASDGTDYVDFDTPLLPYDEDFSINLWANSNDTTSYPVLLSQYLAGDPGRLTWFYSHSGFSGRMLYAGIGVELYSDADLTDGVWHMITLTREDDNWTLYIDGVENDNLEQAGVIYQGVGTWLYYDTSPAYPMAGLIDEVGVWGRELTVSEIEDLWNGGDGITWTDEFGTAPSVTLTSPENNSNLTTSNVDLVATVTDDQYVENVTLYIDGTVNETKTTHVNGSYTFSPSPIADGLHNWSILAYDNDSRSNQSATWFFNISQPPVYVELLSPDNAIASNNITLNMTCIGYKDTGVTQLNMTIDGAVNYTATNSTPGENLTITQFLDFTDGNHNWSCSATDGSTSAMSSTRTFTIDTEPNIQFVSPTPADGSNQSVVYIPVNISLTETYFENLTINFYKGGVLNESVTFTDDTRFYNKTGCFCDTWEINATVWTTTGQSNSTETRTIYVDVLAPEINITAPPTLFDYLIDGETLNLNWTVEDERGNLDSCWYVYNGTTTDVNCSLNTTTFNYIYNYNSLVFYANDTFGNEANQTRTWVSHLYLVDESYDSTVVETASTVFEINLVYDSSKWSALAGFLYYGGTLYSPTITTVGNTINAIYSLSIPAVAVEQNKTFYWIFNLTNSTNTYTTTTTPHNQTINKVNFTLCDYSENPILFFKTFSATDPSTSLNATFESAWSINDISGGATVLTRSFEDETEVNSSWGFCITPNNTNYTLSVDISVDATNYTPTSHYIVNSDYDTSGENISLYLLADSAATLTQLKVVNQDYQAVEDVYVTIQRYDLGTDTYYNVGMARTSDAGTDLAYLNWYDTWYRFIGIYEGEVVFTAGPEKISASPRTFSFGDVGGSEYEGFGDILYSLTFSDDTDNFVLSYVDPTGEASSYCLRVIKRNVTADYSLCDSCETSNSATLYCNIAAYGNGTFIADFYATGSPRYYIDQLYELRNAQNELYDLIGNDNGTGMAIIFAGIVLSMFLISPAIGVFGIMLGMLGAIALGFQPLDYTSFMGIVVVGGLIMWAVQR